ncbi:MAG: hypothetical protein ORN51_04200, partial [Akkermansiaceae bacterium]|nr:hypothetical protein [Akkermansiaceae bacterium]
VKPEEKPEPNIEKTEPAAESAAEPTVKPTPPSVPVKEQVTEPTPEPVPEPAPAPEVAAPVHAAPKYDVAGFFERARRIMLDRAKPLLTAHQTDLTRNFTDFERLLMREARRTHYERDFAEDKVREAIKEWKIDGIRIPTTPSEILQCIPDIDEIAAKFEEKETAIDEQLKANLLELSGLYTHGLEMQVDRLKATDDPGAIELIEKEIERNNTNADYFPDLMTGQKADGE